MQARAFDRDYLYRYRARYVRCLDGDTVAVEVDQGFWGMARADIRLRGYSAAERWQEGGDAARERLEAVIALGRGGAWPLRVVSAQKVTIVMQQMTFTRYVGDVLIEMPDGELASVVALLGPDPHKGV